MKWVIHERGIFFFLLGDSPRTVSRITKCISYLNLEFSLKTVTGAERVMGCISACLNNRHFFFFWGFFTEWYSGRAVKKRFVRLTKRSRTTKRHVYKLVSKVWKIFVDRVNFIFSKKRPWIMDKHFYNCFIATCNYLLLLYTYFV